MEHYLHTATQAAQKAGQLLKTNFGKAPEVDAKMAHDIKLALDVECQRLITEHLLSTYPQHALYGEEGLEGDQSSEFNWIVDPLDGTVNYFYGLPHFCVSIGLRQGDEIIAGVIYDPMREELFTATREAPALLNGLPIQASGRADLGECVATVGFSKSQQSLQQGLPLFALVAERVRKMRMLGSAALEMAYLASGRTDIYIERNIGLWDIAAGKIILEKAGGTVKLWRSPLEKDKLSIVATNGAVDLAFAQDELGLNLDKADAGVAS
jgi:myo-inositol-1(or 4)-monophosphatase